MEPREAQRIIEALLFVSGHPLPLKRIVDVLQVEAAEVRRVVQALTSEYEQAGHAFRIQEVAGGYRLATDEPLAPWIQRALQQPKPDAVSAAALETLAIITYRQPMTKADIEAIRGVDVTASLETLIERRFVRIAGRKETPGRPFLYGTTAEFLRHFGLRSLDALPSLKVPVTKEPSTDEPAVATKTD